MNEFKPEIDLSNGRLTKSTINFHLDHIEEKSVLGIDIYKYSDYEKGVYEYIPVLFNLMFDNASNACIQYEKYFFTNFSNLQDIKDRFISTGDGGFLIFDDAFQALIFSMYFQMGVHVFNSGKCRFDLECNLYEIIGKIELRYCITTDSIYKYKNNYYGIGIINNARILVKDHLNRFLLDINTLDWFSKKINTIESLSIITINSIMSIMGNKSSVHPTNGNSPSMLFDNKNKLITFVSVQKLGTLKSKNTTLDVYNLYILFQLASLGQTNFNIYIASLGNTNTLGIE